MPTNWRLRRLLAQREIGQSELIVETAEALGVKRNTVRGVIAGNKTSQPIETHIADRLGVLREDIFGGQRHGRIVPRKK